MLIINIVWIFSLKTYGCCRTHCCIQISIFTKVFPCTRPTLVTAQVHCRTECPCDVSRTCLVGSDACCTCSCICVECCSHIYVLWEHSTTTCVCCTMILVQSHNTRNTHRFHRPFLDGGHYLCPLSVCRRNA